MSIFDDSFFTKECPECYRRRMEENARQIMQQYIEQFRRDQEREQKYLEQAHLNFKLASKEDIR